MKAAIEARFRDTAEAVQKLQARGGKVVFVRFPVTGELKELEDRATPRAGTVGPSASRNGRARNLLRGLPGAGELRLPRVVALVGRRFGRIHKRLVPHLRTALGR